ncbi:hypothetical protein BURK1_03701 [Burkholderiales bacterium]|nr:hypothetical protein BURK1_03701 [Burkholderiales bacterium]
MNTRRRLLVAAAAAPIVLAGCKVRTINYFPVNPARVRFVNVVFDSVGLDALEGDTAIWSALPFEGSTDFVEFDNNEKTFRVRATGTATDLADATLTLAGRQPYSLIAFGALDATGLLLIPDAELTGSDSIQLRLIDVAFGGNAISLYITAPDVVIDENLSPNLVNIGPASSTVTLRFTPGTYRVRATLYGTTTVIYDSGPIDFPSETSTDIVLYTLGSTVLLQGMLLDVDGAGRRIVAPSRLSALKIVHAAFQAGSIRALDGGTQFATDIAYASATVYTFPTVGPHTLSFEATSVPGAAIASLQKTLESAVDTTVMLVGFPGAVQAIALADENRPPIAGRTRVRFVNASSDDGAYDVYVGDTKQVTALAARTSSAYFSIEAAGYAVTFRDPGTGVVRLTIADQTLGEGRVASIYLIGAAGELSALVTTDR